MCPIQETELAGIGRKFVVETRSNENLIIVMHDSGKVELYSAPKTNTGATTHVATLEDEEARQVAAIIGRTIYRPEAIERLDRHGVVIMWHLLGAQSFAAGKTPGELQLTQRTGASVIAAVGKDGTRRANPEADYLLHEGAQIALAGTLKQVQAAIALLEKGSS